MTRRPRLPRPGDDPVPAGPPDSRWEQPELPAPGQSLRFHARHWTAASVSSPALDRARAIASRLGEARGWNPRVQEETRRALAVMLASHVPGEKIPWSALEPALRPRDLSVSRAAAITALRGHKRHQALVALRSLTRHCNKNGLIFTDPAARIRSAPRPETIILPLPASRVSTATRAAVTPAARLALALAAVHALRPEAIRRLALGDIDLGNRRITVSGQSRPLDDLTRRLILEWLGHRRQRWPRTASPYLLINNQAAMTTRPVSENWLAGMFRGLGVTLEQLRVDRQLDEALTAGPDPLHLSAVFGIDDETAIKYAAAARYLLASAAEDQPPR